MALLDIFKADGFSTAELSAAIRLIPNQWGMIGDLGVFPDRAIRTPTFQLEEGNSVLTLVQSSPRGTDAPGADRGMRKMRDFRTLRIAQERRITAADVDGIRAFGSETELMQIQDEVAERMVDIRANIDITREWLRAGALAGVIREADNSQVTSLFTEFGITQKVVDFVLGTATTNVAAKIREVRRHIEVNILGDAMTGVVGLCSPAFWDKLIGHAKVAEAYQYYTNVREPLRDDLRYTGFVWQGVTFYEYQGSAPDAAGNTRAFIADGDCRFFPVGTRATFAMFNAPADYRETVNTPGQPFYAKMAPDPRFDRYVDLEGQSNCMPICMRPAVLVRGHSSN